MKILMVNNVFPPGFLGGYELGMFDVAKWLAGRGHGVHVLTSDYFLDEGREITAFEVTRSLECVQFTRQRERVDVAKTRGPYVIGRNIGAMYAAMREYRPDVVMLCNLAGLGALGMVQFVVGAGYRPVLYLMDDVFQLVRESRGRFHRYVSSFGLSEYVSKALPIAMSERLRDEVRATLGPDLPDPVIVPGWHGKVSGRSEVSLKAREDHRCRFVFSSQLADHKGISIALRAVSAAAKRGATGFTLDLFGPGDSDAVMGRAAAMGLADIVRYRGTVAKEEMSRRFAEYDAFLMPTWEREPFGFVVPEAAANGCLPIMTAQIGASEWFLDGVDCFKLRRDSLAFAGAILRFLSLSPEVRRGMQAKAKRTAIAHLGIGRWIGVIESVTEKAAAGGGRWDADRAERSRAAMLFLDDMWGTIVDGTF
jgi:glycosyltransferase involved in cell wall biosynthesis